MPELVRLAPQDHDAFFNWGSALVEKAKITNTIELYEEAIEKSAAAREINQIVHKVYENMGVVYLRKYSLSGNEDDLNQARQNLEEAGKRGIDPATILLVWNR
ncbi:MAG: hypothetical protein ABJ327_21085 [Litoreibacter sp.]